VKAVTYLCAKMPENKRAFGRAGVTEVRLLDQSPFSNRIVMGS
jgi:hypothetical protein